MVLKRLLLSSWHSTNHFITGLALIKQFGIQDSLDQITLGLADKYICLSATAALFK